MAKTLTLRQLELLSFLKEYHKEHKLMPSTRDIQKHFGFASQTAVMGHLKALERKGFIIRHPNKARAVILPDSEDALPQAHIPAIPVYRHPLPKVLNETALGQAVSNIIFNPLSLGISAEEFVFAFKTEQDNMSSIAICPGDIVICLKKRPKNKDIVIATYNEETVIKRYIRNKREYFLHDECEHAEEPIPVKKADIQGKVISIIRRM